MCILYIARWPDLTRHCFLCLAPAWIDVSLLRRNVQIDRPNELEEWVVLSVDITLLLPMVTVHKFTYEDLDFE